VQYFTHLPVILVGTHMLGACLVLLAALTVLAAVRPAPPAGPTRMIEVDVPDARAPQHV